MAGCSTPGPLHLYAIAAKPSVIHDIPVQPDDKVADVPAWTEAEETVVGFAYDPFTDHFFLRLQPGNLMRVVDRPARKIKREQTLEGVPAPATGDLAIRPRDGHLFVLHFGTSRVDELTRFGQHVRTIALDPRVLGPSALAYDGRDDTLLVLAGDGRSVHRCSPDGSHLDAWALDRAVSGSIGFDAAAGILYAPLVEDPRIIGAFDRSGRCTQTVTIPAEGAFIDVGPHSFLRVF